MVVVVTADPVLVAEGLAHAGDEGDVVVLDPSGVRLEEAEEELRDSRLWFLVGDPAVVPLPDASVDAVVGADPANGDFPRVMR